MTYTDHFGKNSDEYLRFRPHYPDELYQYLAGLVNSHELAWDCGTGNGQAAVRLAEYFHKVIATDLNQAQLNVAMQKENVYYICSSAEKLDVPDASVDLITVAQALHWFNLNGFYDEVRRVAKPDGIIAAWCYGLGTINPHIDMVIRKLYYDILGDDYWPKERRYIDEEYGTISFPFKRISVPEFTIKEKINFSHLIGYLSTWSAVKEFQKQNRINPVDMIFDELVHAWKEPDNEHLMEWPVFMLVGEVHSSR